MSEKWHKIIPLKNEQSILGILYGVGLNPKDDKTNEYILDENKKVKLDIKGILEVSKNRLGDNVNILISILESLLTKEMISVENGIYSLTETGRKIGKEIRNKWTSEVYDNLLIRCAKSKAYAKFCEKVYGKNLLQFNVIDMQQLEMMLDKMKINPKDVVLDLGCGLGKITEYIANKTNANITGIDISQKSIKWVKANTIRTKKINYEVMDINELNYPSKFFDVIIALDVLFWIEDLEPVIKKLKDILKLNGRMGIFYVQFKNQENPAESLKPENTKLAKFLTQNRFIYEVIDISQKAIEIWNRKLIAGKELRAQFLNEGNQDIIDERLADGIDVIKKFETNQQKRYFFYVKYKK